MVENETHYITMGLDADLDLAMRYCVEETTDLLQDRCGLTFEESLTCASAAIDFEVTQAVDQVKGIHAMIPKKTGGTAGRGASVVRRVRCSY